MQSDWKQIYKLTAERTGNSEQQYKDIGNFVFQSLYANLRRPSHLIFKLKGVGTWYMRKKRMEVIVNLYPPDFDKKPEDFHHPLALLQHENKVEIYKIFKERLKDYEKYLGLRKEIRSKRNESQILLEPPQGED
jgi:hypothetical protein